MKRDHSAPKAGFGILAVAGGGISYRIARAKNDQMAGGAGVAASVRRGCARPGPGGPRLRGG